ncbi:MAG: NAD-binding protein, partial [Deltaproteobacteria bacterium]|nr:NAD-binding protein [Deltaproteobacteria bacterium]
MIRLFFHFLKRSAKARGKQLLKVTVATVAILFFAASGFMYFESVAKPDLAWSDAIWWAFVTMTTVGYGDFFPATAAGRYLIGIPTIVFGISILGYLLSTVATYLIEARSKELKGMLELDVRDHILIIHYPDKERFLTLLRDLRADDKTAKLPIVLVDDTLEELPEALMETGVRFVRGSPTSETVLGRACYKDALYAIILSRDGRDPSSDNHSLAVVLTLEKLHSEMFTVAEVIDPEHIDLLYRAGCDSVVCLASLSTNFLAQELLDPGVQLVLEQLTNNSYGQQIYISPITTAKGRTYSDVSANLHERGMMVLGIERDRKVLLNPEPSAPIDEG